MKPIKAILSQLHWFVFALFVIIQAVIMQNVVLFGDDWYYSTIAEKGFSEFVSQNVGHYMNVNGRALVHIIDELLLWDGSIVAWRIFNTVAVAAIVFFVAAIAAKTYKNGFVTPMFKRALVGAVCLFSLINIYILRQTVYWATGALNYVFPVALTLIFTYLMLSAENKLKENRGLKKKAVVLLPLLAFFASATSEQASFATFAVILYIIVTAIIEKQKVGAFHIVTAAASAVGLAMLILSPGNAVRMTYYAEYYNTPFFERLISGAGRVIYGNIGKQGMYLVLLALFITAFVSAAERTDRPDAKLSRRLLPLVPLVSSAAAAVLYVIALETKDLYAGFLSPLFLISFAITLISIAVRAVCEYKDGADREKLLFYILAAGLQVAMFVSPEFGARAVFVSAICLFIPILRELEGLNNRYIAVTLMIAVASTFFAQRGILAPVCLIAAGAILIAYIIFRVAGRAGVSGSLACGVTLLFILMCFSQYSSTLTGYAENYNVHETNADLVEQYKKEPPENGVLCQYYLVNDIYKYTMPYDNLSYHWEWYLIENDLPKDTEMVYYRYYEG